MIGFKTLEFVGEVMQAFGVLFVTVQLGGLRGDWASGSISEIPQVAGSIWCAKACYCLLWDRRSISWRNSSRRVLRRRRSRQW